MSQNNRYMAVSVTDTKADTKRPKVGGQSRGTGVQDASVAALERELAIYKRDSGIEMEELRAKVNNMPKGGGAGEPGKDGVGIESVEQTVTSTESGGENKVEITLTDGQKTEVVIRNGKDGKDGEGGGEGGNVTPESIGALPVNLPACPTTSVKEVTTTGRYYCWGSTDLPPGVGTYGYLEVFVHPTTTNHRYLRYTAATEEGTWECSTFDGSTWTEWRRLATTDTVHISKSLVGNEDLNTITDEGEYYHGWWQETIQNSPVHSAFHLSVERISAAEVSQTYTAYTGGSNDVWFRQSNNGKTSWSAWKKIATTDYAVNKAGDTMTGKLYTSATTNGSFGSASDDGALRIDGGTSYDKGAFLTLFGKDAWESGNFQLVAGNGDLRKELKGNPWGGLTWDNNNIYHAGNKPTAADVGAFGQLKAWTGTDLNDFKSFGAVLVTTSQANRPTNTAPYATVWNISGNGSAYLIQNYLDVVSMRHYYRGFIDGAWKDWKQIATTDYIDEQILKGEW
jgi:hypothetical protein